MKADSEKPAQNNIHWASKGKSAEIVFQIFIALLVLAILLPESPLYKLYLERDTGVFHYIGWLITQGKIPYRDVWDHKPPVIFFINALGLWLSGGSRWGVWGMEAVFLSLSGMISLSLLKTVGVGSSIFGDTGLAAESASAAAWRKPGNRIWLVVPVFVHANLHGKNLQWQSGQALVCVGTSFGFVISCQTESDWDQPGRDDGRCCYRCVGAPIEAGGFLPVDVHLLQIGYSAPKMRAEFLNEITAGKPFLLLDTTWTNPEFMVHQPGYLDGNSFVMEFFSSHPIQRSCWLEETIMDWDIYRCDW